MFQLAQYDGHQSSRFQEHSLVDGIFTANSQHLHNISTWCHHRWPHHIHKKMPIRVTTNHGRQHWSGVMGWGHLAWLSTSSFCSFITRCLWNNLGMYGKHTFIFSFAWRITKPLNVVETCAPRKKEKKKASKTLWGKYFINISITSLKHHELNLHNHVHVQLFVRFIFTN